MTRRLVDISDYQTGLNVDAVAAAADGIWCKVGDWAWIARYGPPGDNIHDAVIARCSQLGRPVGSYLFVRPGQTDPATQINWWRAHCPDGTSIAPMIDLEATAISGVSLRDWVSEALDLTTRAFGMVPVLYWSKAFADAYGMGVPTTPHIPMVAEYHWGYQTQYWQNVNLWEAHAYSAFGGPDVPSGYPATVTPRSLIWQWTSSAQIPGFLGLVDCDLVPDAAWQLITDGSLSPSSVDPIEDLMASNQELFTRLCQVADFVFAVMHDPDETGQPRWGNWYADSRRSRLILERLNHDAYVASTGASAGRNAYDALFAGAADASAARAGVDRLATAGVDTGALAVDVAARIAPLLPKGADEKAVAAEVIAEFGALFIRPPAVVTVDPAPPLPPLDVPLPDPHVEARASAALADLSHSVFDPDAGIVATVARQVEKMTRTAPGQEPTAAQIHDALLAAAADATTRAAAVAAATPEPTPAGDMGGTPEPDPPAASRRRSRRSS